MKKYTSILRMSVVFLFLVTTLIAQDYQNFQLRLEPVWARVADALGEIGSVESAEFSPDGKYIVSGTKFDNSVIVWRTSDGAEMWRQYAAEEVERVGWSADGKYVAAGSEDYLVTVYDTKSGEIVKILKHERGIDGLIWSNTGSLLASGEERREMEDGSTEGYVRIFEFPSGEEVASFDFGNTVNELFFSKDDALLVAVGHEAVKVYRTSDWEMLRSLDPGDGASFTSGMFSPDAQHVVAVGGPPGPIKGFVYIWEVESGKLLKRFNHTGKKIESIAWHPNGQYIAHAGHDPYIYVYRVDEILKYGNDQIPVAHQVWASDNAEYIDFNADGSFLVSAHQNGLIKLWVWMGEDPELNKRRHSWVKTQQTDSKR